MKQQHGYAVRLAALLAAVSIAAGCSSSEPKPRGSSPSATVTSPSSSTTTTASPTTTPSPSESGPSWPAGTPEAAKRHTPEGAVEFVRYFISRVNDAWTRPESSAIPPFSTSTCNTCQSWLKSARELERDGQRYAADPVVLQVITDGGISPTGRRLVKANLDQRPVNIVDSKGVRVDVQDARKFVLFYALDWTDGRWFVAGVAFPQ